MKIFLVGFMGSGKTYWGRIWANQSSFSFIDLDEMIETDQQKTIAGIFDENGEEYFRHTENRILFSLAEKDNCIIACGGGTPCYGSNMQWMNEHGTTVYLSASTGYLLKRVLQEKEHRPLLSKIERAELPFFIEQKLKERESFYRQAKIILPVEELRETTIPQFLIPNS